MSGRNGQTKSRPFGWRRTAAPSEGGGVGDGGRSSANNGSAVAAASGVSDGRRLRGLGRAVRTAALPRRCRSGDASIAVGRDRGGVGGGGVGGVGVGGAAARGDRAAIATPLLCRSADGGRTYRSSECASAGGGGATRAGVPLDAAARERKSAFGGGGGGSPPRTATIAASS